MQRFLMLLAVAAIAGTMYVAAAPGGLRSAGPTQAQFKALKVRVANLQKVVGQVKKESDAATVVLTQCVMYHAQAVDNYGDGTGHTSGYSYTDPTQNGGQPFLTTALDVAPSTETSSEFYFLGVNPACAPLINSHTGSASTARSRSAFQRLFALARAR
jgi:hypothetical protein